MDHLPKGYHAVTPYLRVKGAQAFLDFMRQAFGAEILSVHKMPDGLIANAEFRLEGCILEVADYRGDQWAATQVAIHLFVPDVDAAHQRAVAAGAKDVHPPMDHDYGERSSAVRDAWGNDWFLARVTDHTIRSR